MTFREKFKIGMILAGIFIIRHVATEDLACSGKVNCLDCISHSHCVFVAISKEKFACIPAENLLFVKPIRTFTSRQRCALLRNFTFQSDANKIAVVKSSNPSDSVRNYPTPGPISNLSTLLTTAATTYPRATSVLMNTTSPPIVSNLFSRPVATNLKVQSDPNNAALGPTLSSLLSTTAAPHLKATFVSSITTYPPTLSVLLSPIAATHLKVQSVPVNTALGPNSSTISSYNTATTTLKGEVSGMPMHAHSHPHNPSRHGHNHSGQTNSSRSLLDNEKELGIPVPTTKLITESQLIFGSIRIVVKPYICPKNGYKESKIERTARSLCRSIVLVDKLEKSKSYSDRALEAWNVLNPMQPEMAKCEYLVWQKQNCKI